MPGDKNTSHNIMDFKANEPIAIVGSACRFSGEVNSPAKLWELLREPRDVQSEIPKSRFSAKGFYHPDGQYHGHSNVLRSYTLSEDPGVFDAQFFGIKPVEAKALDPQQRLLLETVYEGLESAGIPIERMRGSDTGVYVGLMYNDYESMLLRDLQAMPTYQTVGTQRSIMSNRISYFFDWHGPSMTIDTACSSSLVAVHLATQALRMGDSRTVLACGSNLLLGPEHYVGFSKLKMLSPDGRSKMWDLDANGYARGDGVAVVVLKTLSAAIEDGDHIECIIRETGINQDGTTKGITLPSASAQQTLISDTYAKAGLNPLKEEDRCQYFEAHGTGTPAGDPIEAEAIKRAFFGDLTDVKQTKPLYVGSIKTVLGHTEGTAGIASILKASLALQHGCIPPNLLFRNLNPQVAPFYANLEIPITAVAWPALLNGQPRRVSVNSFGFGGANAHAILESFDSNTNSRGSKSDPLFTPLVFSASSEQALAANLSAYSKYLELHSSINLHDLAATLRSRRSALPFKVSFSASSLESLKSKIDAKLHDQETAIGTKSLLASKSKPAKLLGIFTGQGAQYARMGAELVENSSFAKRIVKELEDYLALLPKDDRPSWSLESELIADSSSSRIDEASISQPLCTAIQILLVELFRLAHIKLDGVVGHSSGEIGAAYAAGYLSARDAMYISYYRGLHCSLVASPKDNSSRGAMLAVGTSMEDATNICQRPEFSGRVTVAACNSSSSVTLSGDDDAIAELEQIFEKANKFRRRLRVNTAYHSHHVLPISEPYLKSLRSCCVQVQDPSPDCIWFSSVYDEPLGGNLKLKDSYWVDNMVKPVLFSQAVNRAISTGNFNIAVEIGPHPALKGPAIQTIHETLDESIPYHGTLARGTNAIETTSDAFGLLWTQLDSSGIDLSNYDDVMSGKNGCNVLKDLPTYQWNHDRTYWSESRLSRSIRQRKHAVHSLLGDMCADSSQHHLSWRNLLRASEVSWISGHQLQGQIVFPAAGYVSTALEAAQFLAEGSNIQLIEIRDFDIHHPMVFDAEDAGIEILVSLVEVSQNNPKSIRARFTYSSAVGKEPQALTLMASGEVEVLLGELSPAILPQRGPTTPNMIEIDKDRFYSSLAELGYTYGGPFRALSSLTRKLGKASGLVGMPILESDEKQFLAHPAMMDSAIQSVLLAHSYPNDGQLWSLHVPTSIRRVRVNPSLCGLNWSNSESVSFDSAIVISDRTGIIGDVDIYGNEYRHAAIQIEGMRAIPFASATSADDKKLFSHMSWGNINPDGGEAAHDDQVTQEQLDFVSLLERLSTFYVGKFDREVPLDHPVRSDGPLGSYLNYVHHINVLLENGKHRHTKKEWINDTFDDIMAASARFSDTPDVKIMHIIGEQMPRVFRRETNILEHIRPNGLLEDYYLNALGLPQCSKWLARIVGQIAHRYPNMNILEIGAGTGGATKSILKSLGQDFSSYTFTDISTGFFESAESIFTDFRSRMSFKVLDAERDPISQGFDANSYDLVVASFVIHATSKLEQAMQNVRRLLKPGGFFVLAEITNNDQTSIPFIFGTLSGWWAGVDEGRVLSPCISPERWDTILRNTGFSGIDTITPDRFNRIHPFSVFVSQAIDDRVTFLREPLSAHLINMPRSRAIEDLIIIGGSTLQVFRLVAELKSTLGHFSRRVTIFKTLDDVDHALITSESTVLSLTELDGPIFEDITPTAFDSLKNIFGSEKTLLWVTHGRRADNPFSNMTVGFGRTAVCELPELRLQFLDMEWTDKIDARIIAETLLRFHVVGFWAKDEGQNSLLYSVEPEIVVEASGRQIVPRLEAISAANDRYNSARRLNTQDIDIKTCPVEIRKEGDDYIISEPSRPNLTEVAQGSTIQLHATHAIISALKTRLGYQFLTLGVDSSTGGKCLTLAGSLTSIMQVPESAVLRCDIAPSTESRFLLLVAANLLSMSILDTMLQGQCLLVHNPDPVISQVISQRASEKGVKVIFTTSSNDTTVPASWIKLPPFMPQRAIQQLLPKDITCFVGLSTEDYNMRKHESIIMSCLPPQCHIETSASIFLSNASIVSTGSNIILSDILKRAVGYVENNADMIVKLMEVRNISIDDISACIKPRNPLTVVQWSALSSVPVHISTIDSKPLFKNDKTYWLVGLSGSLGLSLCDWMIEHGAKYVVITSRNPKVDPVWVETNTRRGAVVKIFSNDVTNENDLRSVYDTICATLPPIAGVAQGAMVLKDTPIRDMSLEQMTDVLRPKVDGSLNLDRLFQHKSLDFLIFFSSILGITGNMGQANYTAANTFMCALAAQRRKQGLAASVVNIGVIVGVGYVTREVSYAEEQALRKGGLMWLSEKDFHQIFAEGIKSSHPDSSKEIEISVGVREILTNSPYLPTWHKDPKFARFIVRDPGNDSDQSIGNAGVSIKDRLKAATSQLDVEIVVKDSFVAKLRAVLQMETGDDALMKMRTDEIGLDSLIAVDIRSWLLKNFQINVPVLKILGGVSVAELVHEALQNLPAEVTPNVDIDPDAGFNNEEPNISLKTRSSNASGSQSTVSLEHPNVFLPHTNRSTPPSSSSDKNSDSELTSKQTLERSSRLSFSQSLFWVVDSLMEDKTTLNHTVLFRIAGNIRINKMRHAVATVGQHHEALRTCFILQGNQHIMQGILESGTLELEHKYINNKSEITREYEDLKSHVYDLASGQVMRIRLLSHSFLESYLLIGFHHINIDGISHQILIRDLDKVYRGKTLNPNVLQYADYSDKQRAEFEGGDWAEDIAFWKNEFETIPEPLPLTRSRVSTRLPLNEYIINSTHIRIDATLADRIRKVARANKATSFHFYVTAFKILLHRLTNVEDLSIGIADGNRKEEDTLESLGPYLNLLPLRFQITSQQTFGQSIAETRAKTYSALTHSRVQFETILNELQVSLTPTHTPIFQAFVDYRQGAQERQSFADCTLEMMEIELGRTGYDLSLDVIDNPGGDALVTLMGQRSLYSESDMKIFANFFEDILREFVQSPSKRISENWQYRQADTDRALDIGRGELLKRQWPETLVHKFESVVQQNKQKVALIHASGVSLTYYQLAQRTDNISWALLKNGVLPGQNVAVFQESTPDWICSMLAIMKVGAVYIPLDPGTKVTRLAMVVSDCNPVVILTDVTTQKEHRNLNAPKSIFVDISTLTEPSKNPIEVRATPNSLAMVYYTSGSTGNPKGIAIKHEGLRAVFEGSSKFYGLNSDVVFLLQSSLGFDMTLIQIFLAFPVGGTVAMISRDMRGDSVSITKFLVEQKVTHTAGTPSEYSSWIRFGERKQLQSSHWKVALCGAEPLREELLERFRSLAKSDLRLFNIYGATETTVYATQQELNYKDEGFYHKIIPAGFSLPNKSMYIIDEQMHLLPVGLPGEIVLAGVGVADGYFNNDAMTEVSFIPDVYASQDFIEKGWTTMYRTKDRGRLLNDGSVSIEGRIGDDTEIKLRGLRIDLKDIEQTILRSANGAIAEAVASLRSTAGNDSKFLVAHVVFSPGNAPIDQESFLRQLLANLPLPQYMCPTVIVPIDKMPVTVSSKLDRRAVSKLAVARPSTTTSAPHSLSDDEAQLKAVWNEVLPQDLFDISSESDFFHVGGTSLLLVQLQALIQQRFGISVRLAELFRFSILRTMAKLVGKKIDAVESMTIDWEWETRPSPDLQIGTAGLEAAPAAHPKVILLTGCAGFLGRHLLKSLIDHSGVEKIICVAVRQLHKRLSTKLIPTNDRVFYYEGDLREPCLGLSEKDTKAIFSEIDAVIHNGADVSHLKSYFTLRRANLNATKELARLCLPRRIPFHYISTAGVSMFTFWQTFGEETASIAQPPIDGTNGYKASKWASEQYLERLNKQLRLPMWLHRPSDMVREDDDEAQWDLLHTLLGYSRKLKAVPLSENLWGWLDLVAVDHVSTDVVQMVVDNKPRATDGGVSYVHQTGDMAIPIDEMKEFFEEESGHTSKFEKIPIEEWARRAEAAGMYPAVAAVFSNVPKLPRALCFPRFVKTWKPAAESD